MRAYVPRTVAMAAAATLVWAGVSSAQTPQPFPRPGSSQPTQTTPPPRATEPAAVPPQAASAASVAPENVQLGVPLYPNAQFIGSYDAGRGQRYYLYGTSASFADLVSYYRTMLKSRGDVVYEEPPVHIFEIGRFNEETMSFPPSVAIKDYSWGGSQGYLMPLPGGKSQRFPTVIQIVPVSPTAAR